jgi:hypothetical protein
LLLVVGELILGGVAAHEEVAGGDEDHFGFGGVFAGKDGELLIEERVQTVRLAHYGKFAYKTISVHIGLLHFSLHSRDCRVNAWVCWVKLLHLTIQLTCIAQIAR